MNENRIDYCQWQIGQRKCLQPSDITYSARANKSVGMCLTHFGRFCEYQDKGEELKALEKIGLKKRNKQ